MTTFVLIHGSYQGGWIWQPVANRLRELGHIAYAPTMEGCAERAAQLREGITTETQADELAKLLFFEDLHEVVLVGTSSGGMILARLAEIAPNRVSRLVFADALALKNGEAIKDIVTRPATINNGLALGPSREDAENRLFADLEPSLRSWAVDRCGLHPIAIHTSPVRLESFWTKRWNATVIYCRRAINPGEAHQRRCANALDAHWHELDTGHYPMLSATDQLLEILLEG